MASSPTPERVAFDRLLSYSRLVEQDYYAPTLSVPTSELRDGLRFALDVANALSLCWPERDEWKTRAEKAETKLVRISQFIEGYEDCPVSHRPDKATIIEKFKEILND